MQGKEFTIFEAAPQVRLLILFLLTYIKLLHFRKVVELQQRNLNLIISFNTYVFKSQCTDPCFLTFFFFPILPYKKILSVNKYYFVPSFFLSLSFHFTLLLSCSLCNLNKHIDNLNFLRIELTKFETLKYIPSAVSRFWYQFRNLG